MKGRQHETFGRFHTADDFHDNIDVGVADHFRNIIRNFTFLDAEIERALAIDFQYALHGKINALRFAVKFPVVA